MLFGIIIVLVAVVVITLLNKAKLNKLANQVKETASFAPPVSVTPPISPTPPVTPPPSQVNIVVNSIFSQDVSISDVTVNGVIQSYTSGTNFPVSAGSEGTFQTTQTGRQTIIVYYRSNVPGQNITLIDSNGNIQCQETNIGNNSMIFNEIYINNNGNIFITATDGVCV